MSKKIFKTGGFYALCLLISGLSACKTKSKAASTANTTVTTETKTVAASTPAKGETLVLISTSYGDMKARLFNETPQHRDNFIKLVNQGFYDSLLFHRVINNFMIQGGDPDSKRAKPDQMLGNGGLPYTVPAEFNPKLFHKKGALCGAREGDDVNPEKASSSCQFYIVQGKKFTDSDLQGFEYRINKPFLTQISQEVIRQPENAQTMADLRRFKQEGKQDSMQIMSKKIDAQVLAEYNKSPHFAFSEEQKTAYKTIGGTPHLDNGYTVFGEVYEGLDVIDKIAAVQTGANDRPVQDLRMKIKIIKK